MKAVLFCIVIWSGCDSSNQSSELGTHNFDIVMAEGYRNYVVQLLQLRARLTLWLGSESTPLDQSIRDELDHQCSRRRKVWGECESRTSKSLQRYDLPILIAKAVGIDCDLALLANGRTLRYSSTHRSWLDAENREVKSDKCNDPRMGESGSEIDHEAATRATRGSLP